LLGQMRTFHLLQKADILVCYGQPAAKLGTSELSQNLVLCYHISLDINMVTWYHIFAFEATIVRFAGRRVQAECQAAPREASTGRIGGPSPFFGPISSGRALELTHDLLVDRADDPG